MSGYIQVSIMNFNSIIIVEKINFVEDLCLSKHSGLEIKITMLLYFCFLYLFDVFIKYLIHHLLLGNKNKNIFSSSLQFISKLF